MLRFGNITEIDVNKGYARVTFIDDGIVSAPLQMCVMGAISNKYFHTFDVNEQVACLMDENSEEGVILGAIFNNSTAPDGGNKDIVRVKFSDNSSIEYNRSTHEYNIDVKGKINITSESDLKIKSNSKVNIEGATEVKISSDAVVNVQALTANITASTLAKIEAPVIQLNGAVAVTGAITVSGTLTAPSGAPITGDLKATGNVEAGANMSVFGDITVGDDIIVTGDINASGAITTPGEISGGVVKDGTVILGTHVHAGVTIGSGSTAPPTP